MNLIIDIGNTTAKLAIYDGNALIFSDKAKSETAAIIQMAEAAADRFAVQNCIISSVSLPYDAIQAPLQSVAGTVIRLDSSTKIPIANRYSTPETLGKDRLAAAVGATVLFPGTSCLVIDAGTAITYDYIKDGAEYLGGNISPGCRTRFKALERYSKSLPLVDTPEKISPEGHSIQGSIESGVISGIMFEIEGYTRLRPENIVIFTGGDAIYFAKKMKNSIFVVCNLVLMGLALITDDYVKKNLK